MQVVGVDFGTTNIRISTWDSSQPDHPPQPRLIGEGDTPTMPAVIAFRRQPRGDISTIVGEDADSISKKDEPDTVVVRNIKRWALANDPYVRWCLDSKNAPRPEWWNPETRSVEVWDRRIPVGEIMRLILAEAFQRAGISGDFEWRAGCPVHADMEYRSELAQALSEFGKGKKVAQVVEEPILFLTLAHKLEKLQPGSYLVYDLGGGSFDCAIAEVEPNGRMTVYASNGQPLMGGATIDELLAKRLSLDYEDYQGLLRIAKEQLTPSNPEYLDGDINLSWLDVEDELNKYQFLGWTLTALREAYITAKVIWKREDGTSPVGGIPSLRLEDMPRAFCNNLDRVILFGGSTKSPYFHERLTAIFGVDKVIRAEDLVPEEIPDPELTALSAGACYFVGEGYAPLYVNRLPARVTLRDTKTGAQVEYEPYQHFVPNFNPAKPFISDRLPQGTDAGSEYELIVADADGEELENKLVGFDRAGGTRSPQLVVDTFGRIGVDSNGSRWVEVENPPWQTERQRQVLQSIMDRQRQFEQSEQERIHIHGLLNENPFGWQSGHG